MKKRNLLALMLLGASLMFVGCGGKPSDDPTKDENNTNQPGTDDTTDKKDDATSDTDDSNAGSVWKVTFDLNGGSGTAPAEQEIEDGKTATEPSIEGITGPEDKPNFAGWTTTADDESTKFSFTTKITANTKLYAFWSAEKYYKVTFSTGDEATTTSEQVKEGDKATKPATDPRKVGYKLAGWYADSAFATAFDFANTVISAETTVYAKFVKAYTVLADAPGAVTKTTESLYGQTNGYDFWSGNLEVSVGDWIILSGNVAFDKLGQIYGQVGITPADGSDPVYPNLPNFYNDQRENISSHDYYIIYKIETAGTLTMAKLSLEDIKADANKTISPVAAGTEVTVTDLKCVHIAAANLNYALPYYLSKSSVTIQWDPEGAEDGEGNKFGAYVYAPNVKFIAPENSRLSFSYHRPEVAEDYKNHYINSEAGWAGTWPNKNEQNVSLAQNVTYTTDFQGLIESLKIGVQVKTKEGGDLVLTNLEISNIPALSFFELD